MSVSTFKPVACRIPPAVGASSPNPKVSKVEMMNKQALPHLQVKEKENPVVTATSRREMMQLTAASIGLLSLLLPAPAEARPRNATIKQKIMEKFEALRQKAGSLKPKDESEEKSNGEKKATGEMLVPTLPNIMNGGKTVVETTLP